jgi:hypothetical protein
MANHTTNGQFPSPVDGEVANVPGDVKALADRLELVLYTSPTKPWTAELTGKLPGRILIATSLGAVTSPQENDVVFLYTP